MNDGTVISGRWGPPPPGLVRRLRLRLPRSGEALPARPPETAWAAPTATDGRRPNRRARPDGRAPSSCRPAAHPSSSRARVGPMLLLIALGAGDRRRRAGLGADLPTRQPSPAGTGRHGPAAGGGRSRRRARPKRAATRSRGVARAFNQMAADLVQRAAGAADVRPRAAPAPRRRLPRADDAAHRHPRLPRDARHAVDRPRRRGAQPLPRDRARGVAAPRADHRRPARPRAAGSRRRHVHDRGRAGRSDLRPRAWRGTSTRPARPG